MNLAPSGTAPPGPPPRSLHGPSPPSLRSVRRPLRRLRLRKVQPAAHLPRRVCCRQPPHTPGPEAQEEPQPGQQVGNAASPHSGSRWAGREAWAKGLWESSPAGPSPPRLAIADACSWHPRPAPSPPTGTGSGRAVGCTQRSPGTGDGSRRPSSRWKERGGKGGEAVVRLLWSSGSAPLCQAQSPVGTVTVIRGSTRCLVAHSLLASC